MHSKEKQNSLYVLLECADCVSAELLQKMINPKSVEYEIEGV